MVDREEAAIVGGSDEEATSVKDGGVEATPAQGVTARDGVRRFKLTGAAR